MSRDFDHEIGKVRIIKDCAVEIVLNSSRISKGRSRLTLVREEGEWRMWSLSAPNWPTLCFSLGQIERILQLREWGWDE